MFRRVLPFLALAVLAMPSPATAAGKLKVVATLSDLAWIAG